MVLLGAFVQSSEAFIESDEAEVEDVDAVPEVLESELCPGSAERLDGLLMCGMAAWFPVGGFVDRGGVADRSPDAAGQLLDCCPGEQDAEAEASPLGNEPYGVEDEDPVAQRFEQVVQVWVELAGAHVEDSPGDGTQVSVLAVEQAERVMGLVDIDDHDDHVADVGLHLCAAVVED